MTYTWKKIYMEGIDQKKYIININSYCMDIKNKYGKLPGYINNRIIENNNNIINNTNNNTNDVNRLELNIIILEKIKLTELTSYNNISLLHNNENLIL
jgi:hypothetical protein